MAKTNMARYCRTGSFLQLTAVLAGLVTAGSGVALAPLTAKDKNRNEMFQKALQLFRFDNSTGHIEFVDHPYLYDGAASNMPLEVIAVFGTTSSGKSTACRFLSCSLKDPTDFPSSEIGADHVPTRGLWASHLVDTEGGRNIVLLDIEGTDNSEQDMHIEQALVKLLALLSEVTSVFVQLRRSATIQSSDLKAIASFVSRVRSTLLQRPESFSGTNAGPGDNFPALLIAHVLRKDVGDPLQAYKITKQALDAQRDVIGTIHENYIQLGQHEGVDLHFDYLPIYELPQAETLQEYIDDTDNSTELLSKVGELVDYNVKPEKPLHFAGRKFLNDIDRLRDKILEVSRPRRDGENRNITPQTFRQILKRGVEEMNQVGPLSNMQFWEKIEVDSCTKRIQEHVTKSEEQLKSAEQIGKDVLQEIKRLKQELDAFFVEGLRLRKDGVADIACSEVLDVKWRLAKGPYQRRAVEKQLEEAKSEAAAAEQRAENERRRAETLAWSAYIERNFPWVAVISASLALIVHKLSRLCCCSSSGSGADKGVVRTELDLVRSMRQMEAELASIRQAQNSKEIELASGRQAQNPKSAAKSSANGQRPR